MNRNIKPLTEGAMMTALTVVLILITWYMPVFSTFGVFMCAVPLSVLAARNGLRISLGAMAAVFAVSSLVTGSMLSSVAMILMSVLPGMVCGYLFGKGKPFFTVLFSVCVAVCVGWLVELYVIDTILMDGGAEKLINELLAQMKAVFDSLLANMPSGGEGGAEVEKIFAESLKMMEMTVRIYFPSIVIMSSMLSGYIIIRLCGFILKRLKTQNVNVLLFSELKAPRSMATVAVVLYIVMMFTNPSGVAGMIIANASLVIYSIIGFCGFSFVDYKLRKSIVSTPLRWLIYAAAFIGGSALMGIVGIILVAVGIFDSSRDYRGLDTGDGSF